MQSASVSSAQAAADRFFAMPWVALAARIAVAVPFLISGFAKLLDFGGAIAEVRGLTGLEPAALFAALVILTQLGGSALLIAGGRLAWVGAVGLAGFTAIATLFAHAFWLKPAAEQFIHRNIFFEHVAIAGGLILVAVLSSQPVGERKPG